MMMTLRAMKISNENLDLDLCFLNLVKTIEQH